MLGSDLVLESRQASGVVRIGLPQLCPHVTHVTHTIHVTYIACSIHLICVNLGYGLFARMTYIGLVS